MLHRDGAAVARRGEPIPALSSAKKPDAYDAAERGRVEQAVERFFSGAWQDSTHCRAA
jgi:hypothetical protein